LGIVVLGIAGLGIAAGGVAVNEVILIAHLVVSMALIGIILLQGPKGEGLGAIGGSARMFHGPRPRETLLTRITAGASVLFLVTGGLLVFLK
jgi:preprotein translocase subunit SecG